MDRKHIEDRHMVALYLADKLSGDERAEFEAYLVEHPELVQDLEHAARLKVGLLRLQERGRLEGLLAQRPWHRQPQFYAWAASIAVVVAGMLMWFGGRTPTQPLLTASLSSLKDRAGQPLVVASTFTLVRTRAIGYDAEIEAVARPTVVALRVLPEVQAQPPVFGVTLSYIDADGALSERAAVPGVPAAADGYVTVYLDASKLAPGRYQLSLAAGSGEPTPATTSNFSLRVNPMR